MTHFTIQRAITLCLVTSLMLLTTVGFGQKRTKMNASDQEDKNTVYRVQATGDFFVNTRGWGGGFQWGVLNDAKKHTFWRVGISTLKSPKETRLALPQRPDSRGIVYGKINTLTTIKGMAGREHKLFTKKEEKGVTISVMYAGGLILGIQKPVYMVIERYNFASDRFISSLERYNPDVHPIDQISKKGPLLKGFYDASYIPGISLKGGVNFEYSAGFNKIRAIETGVNLDTYFSQINILANEKKESFFLTAYIAYQFGRKFY